MNMCKEIIAEKENICRTFEFINYNIPPEAADSNPTFNYTTIGFFDALRTERLKEDENGTLSLDVFERRNESYALDLDGRYSFQNMLAIRKGSAFADDTFWEADPKMPLCFIAFFQLKGIGKGEKEACSLEVMENAIQNAIAAVKDEVAKDKIIKSINMESICYQTFDKNDFIAGIKSDRYDKISDMLLKIHENMKKTYPILYSYSIFAVHNDFIHSMDFEKQKNPAAYVAENPKKYQWIQTIIDQKEKIHSISFQGITNTDTKTDSGEKQKASDSAGDDGEIDLRKRYTSYINILHKALYDSEDKIRKSMYNLYEIIGDFDFRYIARDIPMKNLLWAMTDNGPLNYRSSLLRSTLYSSLLVLNTCKQQKLDQYGNMRLKPKEVTAVRCDELRNHLLAWGERMGILSGKDSENKMRQIQRNATYDRAVDETFFISLWKILVSLSAIERAPSQKYDFESFYWPYRRLIELLTQQKINSKIKPKESERLEWSRLSELSRLIKCLSTALHGSLRTDIQFFQVTDFNVFVNYAPAKLRAFYSAWIKCLMDYYNRFRTEKLECQFVISMNTSPVICTRELKHTESAPLQVENEDYRLMYIEMPERLLYQPEYTSVILAHEVGHYADGRSKRRKPSDCDGIAVETNRYETFLRCISTWYAYLYHSEIITGIYFERERDEKRAVLLMRMMQLYLERTCEETSIYQSIYTFLQGNLYEQDGNELRPRKKKFQDGYIDGQYGEDAIILAQQAMYLFFDPRVEKDNRMNVSMATDEMVADFRFYLGKMWEDAEWMQEVTKGMKDVPLWTRALKDELMAMLRNIIMEVERLMRIHRVSPKFPEIPREIMGFLREPYVDLLAILCMHLTPKQYFDLFSKTNQLKGTSDKDLKMSYPLTARIFAIVQTMRKVAEWSPEEDFLKEWAACDWQHVEESSEKNKDNGDNKVIFYSLQAFWSQVDDSNFRLIKEKETRTEGPKYLTFLSYDILKLVVAYLTECAKVIWDMEKDNPVAAFIEPVLSGDIFTQVEHINQKLWEYEKDCQEMYEMKKG